ncbi:MAG: hypothetical protein GX345_07380 [Clostridiales bacterium]|nr:hypothetical protein [Clostridiales bacterium]
MKRLISVILVLLLLSPLSFAAAPSREQAMQLKVFSYNVSGIPVLGDYQGTQRQLRGKDRTAKIGELMNDLSGCDIIGVQEAFTHYDSLSDGLSDFPYFTNFPGRVPYGDGLGTFSKFPLYNVKHTKWDLSYGVLSGSSDKLAQKGFLYSLVEIAPHVYIDFYVLHADAGKDHKSVEARADNFRQLAAAIKNTPGDRAVIALGDYNFKIYRNLEDDLYTNLIEPTGLKDAWVELHNDGRYLFDDASEWTPNVSESLDRVLYKSGQGVNIEAASYEYLNFTNEKGETYTDHIAVKAAFNIEFTGGDSRPDELIREGEIDKGKRILDEFVAAIKALVLIFKSTHELFYLLGQGIDLIFE